MARDPEGLREAKEALAAGDHRGAIRLCEQVRRLSRVTDRQLVEIWGILGRAHVALGEHDDGLSFLKRADRTDDNVAATRAAYEALEIDEDPAALFEQHDARARRRRKKMIAIATSAAIIVPAVVLYGGWQVQAVLSAREAEAQMVAAVEEGQALGASGTVEACVSRELETMGRCVARQAEPSSFGATVDEECTWYTIVADACVEVAGERDAFCRDLPEPEEPSATAPRVEGGTPIRRWCLARIELEAAADERQREVLLTTCELILLRHQCFCHGCPWYD